MRGHRALRDLGVGLIGFALILAVSHTVGRAMVPSFPQALGNIEIPRVGDGGSSEVSVVSLRADLAPLERPVALLQASGAVDGRLLLDRGESQGGIFLPEDYEEGDELLLVDVNVRFSGSGSALTVVADQMPTDQPRSEGMTVVLTSGQQTFTAGRGACTLELVESGYTVLSRPWGQVLVPHFAGSLVCDEVSELRSGDLVSFIAVFDYKVEH